MNVPILVRVMIGSGATPTPLGDTSTPGAGGCWTKAATECRYAARLGGNRYWRLSG